MPTKRSRKTSKRTVIQPRKGVDATSDVTKPVNSRKRLTWADHLRQIGIERPRQKWPRARAIAATPNAAATSLDASYGRRFWQSNSSAENAHAFYVRAVKPLRRLQRRDALVASEFNAMRVTRSSSRNALSSSSDSTI